MRRWLKRKPGGIVNKQKGDGSLNVLIKVNPIMMITSKKL
jgi:hypothetical protein